MGGEEEEEFGRQEIKKAVIGRLRGRSEDLDTARTDVFGKCL